MRQKLKSCCSCKQEFPATKEFFPANRSRPDGLHPQCKPCHVASAMKSYRKKNPVVLHKRGVRQSPEQKKAYRLAYRERVGATVINRRAWDAIKRDPSRKFRNYCRKRLSFALKGSYKFGRTFDLIGCSPEFLKSYLERRFLPGMSWENYGKGGWHIDHIIPCARFDLSTEENQRKCFHYTNLQPLWEADNLKKGRH